MRPTAARRDLAALLALTALVWASALFGGFVWDDVGQVLEAGFGPSLSWLGRVFRTDVWTSLENGRPPSGYYRPLFVASLGLDRALWGLSPLGHHAQNLGWHLLAVAAVWRLGGAVSGPRVGLVAGVIFALHPLQAEVVAWVSGRADAMVTAAALGAMAVLLPRPLTPGRAIAGGLLALCGLLTKEIALTALITFPVWDRVRHGRLGGWGRYAALAVAGAAWLGLRAQATLAAAPLDERLVDTLKRIPELVGLYAALVVVPAPLSTGRYLDYLSVPLATSLAGTACLFALFAWGLRRAPWVAVGAGVMAAGAWLPTLIGMTMTRQVGERYAYLPIAALALLVASLLERSGRRYLPALIAWGLLASALVQARVLDWRDPVSLTASEVRATPNPYAWHGYGASLCADGRPGEAGPWLSKALTAERPFLLACEHRLQCAVQARGLEDALAAADEVMAACPATPTSADLTAMVLARGGRWEEAERAAEVARLSPETSAWVAVSVALARRRGDAAGEASARAAWAGDPAVLDTQVAVLLAP